MAINKNHLFEDMDGVKCSVVEKKVSAERMKFLKELLESNGIHAMVSADDYIGVPLPVSGGVDLLVLNKDAERAQQILEESPENG